MMDQDQRDVVHDLMCIAGCGLLALASFIGVIFAVAAARATDPERMMYPALAMLGAFRGHQEAARWTAAVLTRIVGAT